MKQNEKNNTSMMGDTVRTWADPLLPLEVVSMASNVHIGDYDHIYIGTLVWGFSVSLPIKEFVKEHDFSGKKIGLFCTHDGGPGATISTLESSLKKSKI